MAADTVCLFSSSQGRAQRARPGWRGAEEWGAASTRRAVLPARCGACAGCACRGVGRLRPACRLWCTGTEAKNGGQKRRPENERRLCAGPRPQPQKGLRAWAWARRPAWPSILGGLAWREHGACPLLRALAALCARSGGHRGPRTAQTHMGLAEFEPPAVAALLPTMPPGAEPAAQRATCMGGRCICRL